MTDHITPESVMIGLGAGRGKERQRAFTGLVVDVFSASCCPLVRAETCTDKYSFRDNTIFPEVVKHYKQ